jgi:putative lipoic acid-binding regulatory protein
MSENLTASLIEYPCEFPLKIFGKQQMGFAQAILEVINKHDPGFSAAGMEMRASKNARYISLTCTIRATSREQLDAVYRELSGHPLVVMVL